jgi:uracil-DNA glycosylase family 4
VIYVPGEGPKNARIVFIGEAPGESEERERRPFVGVSGRRLREDLAKVGISPDTVRITNVCHYKPPQNNIGLWLKRSKRKGVVKIRPNELIISGILELFQELAEIKPNVIVPLGNVALWALTGLELISRRRGSILTVQPNMNLLEQLNPAQLEIVADALFKLQGTKVIPTFHPAFVSREMVMQPIFKLDLKRIAKESATKEVVLPQREIHVDPDEQTASILAARLIESGSYACDIETPGGKLFCVGYSCDPSWSLVLGTDALWKINLHTMLLTSAAEKIFQNGVYDCSFLLKECSIKVTGYGYDYEHDRVLGHDTMFAQHAVYPEWRLGLDFLASVFTREPYYKDEGKGHNLDDLGVDHTTYMRYCGKDACVTKEVAEVQRKVELRDPNFKHHFNFIMSQVPLVIDIMVRGQQLDVQELHRLREESINVSRKLQPQFDAAVLAELIWHAENDKKPAARQAAIELAEKIANSMGREKDGVVIGGFNVYSSPDCQKYLYDVRGFKKRYKVNRNVEEGESVTADEETIKELYGETGDQKLLELITLRHERKLQTSYLNVKHDYTGRTWFSINPVGARSARWSESMTLMGYGFNFQTPPGRIRSIVVAEEGCVLLYLDLSQAEDRIVSYDAQVLKKIEAFETGVDVHALTASLIFGLTIEEVKRRHKEQQKKDGKDGPERYLGKQSNHAFNYGEGPPTFTKKINKKADETGIRVTLQQSRFIRDQHLASYPELRWYWADIEAQLKLNRTLTAFRVAGEQSSWKRRFAGHLNADTFREAYSWRPQHTPPAIVMRAAVNIHHELLPRIGDERARILNQVHDALLIQVPIDGFQEIAEECVKRMLLPVEIHGKNVIIPVDYKVGWNWKEMTSPEKFRTKLEDV